MTRLIHSTRVRRHRAVCVVAAAGASGLLAFSNVAAQTIPASQGRAWAPTFINEFNAGASDLSGWTYDVGAGNGWGNNERQVYTAPAGAPPAIPNPGGAFGSYTTTPVGINSPNVYVQDGNLNIAVIATGSGAGQTYTSGRLKTRHLFNQAYGLFEFRARVPAGQGLWPAVWMMSRDEAYEGWPRSGEIDILETKGQDTGLVQGTLHSGASPGTHQFQTRTFQQSGLRPPGFSTTEWHTYSLQWTAGSPDVAATFRWYVDGVNYYTQQGGWHIPAEVPSTNDDAPFDQPFYFLINMAVGGNYVGNPNIPAGTYLMQLDWLRVYSSELRPTWKNDQSGNWSDASRWTDSISPDSAGADVLFGGAITQPRTVTLDTAKTVGHLTFDNTSSYTLAGTQALMLQSGGGESRIDVLRGSHTISAPVVLDNDTLLTIGSATSTLRMSGPLTAAAGTTLSKSGAGALELQHVRGGHLAVNQGLARVLGGAGTASTSMVQSLTIAAASGASLDLADSALIVDYTGASPIDSIRELIAVAYDGGPWTGAGLTSSAARSSADSPSKTALGLAEAAEVGGDDFAGLPIDSSAVLIKHTYFGDANLDGQVDVADLGSLASAWQTAAAWTSGDFDYSGFVDVNDLGLLASNWQSGVGNPLGPSFAEALASVGLSGATVPEPGCMLLVTGALLGLRRRRNRVLPTMTRLPARYMNASL